MIKPKFVADIANWWRYLSARQLWGIIFAAGGMGLTFLAAFVPVSDKKLLLAVIAVSFQITAANLFAGYGKADKTHATQAIGRLLSLAAKINDAEEAASCGFERDMTSSRRRDVMGGLSVSLSWIAETVRLAVVDWVAFNPHLANLVSPEDRPGIVADAKSVEAAQVSTAAQTPDPPSQQQKPESGGSGQPANQDAPVGDAHD